jgi:hypothetical protein
MSALENYFRGRDVVGVMYFGAELMVETNLDGITIMSPEPERSRP